MLQKIQGKRNFLLKKSLSKIFERDVKYFIFLD